MVSMRASKVIGAKTTTAAMISLPPVDRHEKKLSSPRLNFVPTSLSKNEVVVVEAIVVVVRLLRRKKY